MRAVVTVRYRFEPPEEVGISTSRRRHAGSHDKD
jgi:hypothetical protein